MVGALATWQGGSTNFGYNRVIEGPTFGPGLFQHQKGTQRSCVRRFLARHGYSTRGRIYGRVFLFEDALVVFCFVLLFFRETNRNPTHEGSSFQRQPSPSNAMRPTPR